MTTVKLGLRENWRQFFLLVIINAFVGGMIGMERTIFPEFAQTQFGIVSKTAIFSFIIAFGLAKSVTNYFAGRLSDKLGRKNLLLIGWLFALPIPWILIYASTWNWVVFANCLLGISQGLTWSSTVIMKIDLVGERQRGLAIGLNEFAGYFAVGIVAYLTGYVAATYGITPYPFYIGVFISISGFLLTALWVRDTKAFTQKESESSNQEMLGNVFIDTTFRNKTLSSVTQAGFVNNLNDGMIWGLLPIYLGLLDYDSANIGVITSVYPSIWGIGQLFTGKMSDHYSKRSMLFWGMGLQGLAILTLSVSTNFSLIILLSAILGIGTAMVYPTFLAAISAVTRPEQRAESLGTFRLWRDLGYVFGALLSGITADFFGVSAAISIIGVITVISALIIRLRMPITESFSTNN